MTAVNLTVWKTELGWA